MFEFIADNLATILISLGLIVIVALIIGAQVRNRNKPCHGCPYAKACGAQTACSQMQKRDR